MTRFTKITSRDNARLKRLRWLRQQRGSSAEDPALLYLEGPHLLQAALDAGVAVEELWLTPQAQRQFPAVDVIDTERFLVEPQLLHQLADADSPRGLVAIARRPEAEPAEVRERLHTDSGPLVVLEGIQDPGNLGAIARVTEAAGGCALLRSAAASSWRHPRALRASAGSLLRLSVLSYEDLAEALAALGLQASEGWALMPRAELEHWDSTLQPPRWLAVGSEGAGLSPPVAALAQTHVTIPMAAPVESLNVATSVAIALFELRRRQWGAGHQEPRTDS